MSSPLRTRILAIAGGSAFVTAWARSKARRYGILARRIPSGLQLTRGNRAIILGPKHAFFAAEVAQSFDAYAHALPSVEHNASSVVDFSADPHAFNMCRRCLKDGAVIEAREGLYWLRKHRRAMILSARHVVYASEMAGKFELYFAPLVPELRDGWEVLDFSHPGILQTYRKSGLQFEMASFPEEEEAIEEYFHWYRPAPGDLVFDMGAHCGVSTYHLSRLVGTEGKVVAFEPDPVNFAILQRNIERHGLSNVVAENAAVSGTAGRLAFNSEGTIGSGLVSLLERESVGSIVTVDAVTLADAFTKWGVPAFCKIDIEGAEIDVVAKSGDLLRTHKTNFAFDTHHPKADGRMTNEDIEIMFRNYGYEALSEARPLFTTWARPR